MPSTIVNRDSLDEAVANMFSNPLYVDYLFYAHMVGQCTIRVDDKMQYPAKIEFGVGVYTLTVNPVLFGNFTIPSRLAVLKHEMLHILLNHIGRMDGRSHKDWNWSTDCAANQLIRTEDLPKGGVSVKTFNSEYNVKAKRKESAEYYYSLTQLNKTNPLNDSAENVDPHECWKDTDPNLKDLKDVVTANMIERSRDSTLRSRGNVPVECSEWLSLTKHKPQLNWKTLLRRIQGNKQINRRSTINRRDRRFPHRVDLRGHVKDRTFGLLVVSDVSGSMSNKAVQTTLQEVVGVCAQLGTNVTLVQVDTKAYLPEPLTKYTKSLTRKGHGGTNLFPGVVEANTHRVDFQAVVVLTDGGVSDTDVNLFGSLKKRIIWLIDPTGTIQPSMTSKGMQAFKLK